MLNAWQVLADNYKHAGSPLHPCSETMQTIKNLIKTEGTRVVVLGGTPIFAELSHQMVFIDTSNQMLSMSPSKEGFQKLCRNWMDCNQEYSQADVIVGDGSVNSVGTREAAISLFQVLSENMRPDALLAQRIFVAHELPEDVLRGALCQAFADKRYSEVRFLLYGRLGQEQEDGNLLIADVDRLVNDLELWLDAPKSQIQAWKTSYFQWRDAPVEELLQMEATAFFPRRRQLDELLAQTGMQFETLAAGSFNLAEYTPIFHTVR